ncbi:MAG: DUF2020 domain-containing protein [Geodermatophilaceae bacterium]|nr:DUF2020 domain-containing protein [Geodermatophilaceae bacterium]
MSRISGWAVCCALLLVIGSAGCSSSRSGGDQTAGSSTATPTVSASSTEQSTPPPVPGPPVVAEGPCPYLDTGYVELTIGQRIGRVETITVQGQPAPDCVLYRLDETAAVTIDLTPYADPIAAQNAALALVTAAALPVTDIGDYGGVLVSPGQTLLAVTAGPLLVSVSMNQESSLQARELGTTVLEALPPP